MRPSVSAAYMWNEMSFCLLANLALVKNGVLCVSQIVTSPSNKRRLVI